MLGLALAQFALTPPPPSPSPPPPRPPGESGSGGEEITWTTCDNNGPCTNREAGANFKCTNNGYCNCGDATNCWCDGNNGYCDCGAASRCMCDSNNGYCACPRSGSKCTTTDPFFLDDDDVQQACDFASEFSSDSDFACACAGNNGDCTTTSYSGGSSDSGDSGDGGGGGLHISIMFPSIFFPTFFCIALFSFMACYGNRRRRARSALRAMDQQPGVNLLTGPVAVAMPIGGAAAPPVAVPTCSAPVAVPVGAGAPPIAVPVDARSSPVAVPVGTMPVAAATYVNSPVVVVSGQPMAADGGASSSGLYGGKKI